MIKCPNCGNTAQVRETFSNYSTSLKAQCKSYKCGCGCLFHMRQYEDGTVCGEWRAHQKNENATPTPRIGTCGSIGAQMVREMIGEYERKVSKW